MIKKGKKSILWGSAVFVFVVTIIWFQHHYDFNALAAGIAVPATVTGNNVNVRTKAGTSQAKLTVSKKSVTLSKGKSVTITGTSTVSGSVWYKISFVYSKKTYSGYIISDYVKLKLTKSVAASVTSKTALPVYTNISKKTRLTISSKKITLSKGKAVTILKEKTVSKKKWFYVSFTYGKKTYKGYILASGTGFAAQTAVSSSPSPSPTPSEATGDTEGIVTASALNVRTGAGTSYDVMTYNSIKVQLAKGTQVVVLSSEKVGTVSWYYISFSFSGNSLKGYVSASYISTDTAAASSPAPTSSSSATVSPSPSVSSVPASDEDFEASLDSEGFPESYKDSLRQLHDKYPLWQFKAYNTGCDWDSVISNENQLGKNLITNSKTLEWKSMDTGAYNWSTDSFVPFDGSTWVTASKEALEYYMDPRNFLTTDGIFQFEYLAYMPEYQDISGVERILKNTVMSNANYSYTDSDGNTQTKTYGETFIEAAVYSQVNPFHLATRAKQEVVTSTGLSSSASGSFSGYEGYYNFFNIGATDSTAANGAVINGLKFAMTGNSMSAANKTLFMIPWTSPYNSIVGGAKYIGNNYINKGQNTVYLQKFNVSSYSTYSHQYMANIEAAKSEGQKTYAAYQNFTDIPVVFYIPVYTNMPDSKCTIPSTVLNPNNWLKSLSVTGQTMTPTFKVTDSSSASYTVIVDSDVSSITINAAAASSKASVQGTGIFTVSSGKNTFKVKVTAENDDVRTYTIYVIK